MNNKMSSIVILLAVLTAGCNFTRLAANQTVSVFNEAAVTIDKEHDVWLARTSAVANLKMFEGLLEVVPDNEKLMILASKSFGLFAFAFLEDDLDKLEPMTPKYEAVKFRATDFYHRARRYATLRMVSDYEDFAKAVQGDGKRLEEILADCDEDHVAPLYWLAYSWASIINLNNDDPALLVQLSTVKRIMGWVRKHNGSFENGGPHIFFGAIAVALPIALGGNAKASKASFEKAIAVNQGRFLLTRALYARMYMRAIGDRKGYARVLTEVLNAPNDIMPSQRLANELAKIRAKRWLAEIDEIFE
jgi:hypothetical protein